MARLEGKVAFITGAARGQGRSHAVRLAEEGADIIAIDICDQIAAAAYPMSTTKDLEETAEAVAATGRRVVTRRADVRDAEALRAAFEEGTAALGPVDVVVANAGIVSYTAEPLPGAWADTIATNLTGVFNTVEVARNSMVERGRGGSIVIIGSVQSAIGAGALTPGFIAYVASKHGVVGLMRLYANRLADHFIRVNLIAPTAVRTPMVVNDSVAEVVEALGSGGHWPQNAIPVDLIEPGDISNAVAWLASDDSRYVTGVIVPVDAGCLLRK